MKDDGPTLFKEATEAYRRRLHSERRLARDTESRIKLFEKAWGNVPLVDITPAMAQRLVAELFAGRSPATVNRNLNVLSAILTVAMDEGLILMRPHLRRRRVGSSGTRTVHLELDEIMPVVEHVCEHNSPLAGFFILLLIDTGLRFGEAMRLTWGDLKNDWITVQPREGKTRGRKIPTSPRLIQYMIKYCVLPSVEDTREERIISGRWGLGAGGIGRELNASLRAACKDLRVRCAKDVRVHDLRHTFAFLCASAGADLGDIKEMLGHANIGMTMRYRGFVETRSAEIVRRAMGGVTIGGNNAATTA